MKLNMKMARRNIYSITILFSAFLIMSFENQPEEYVIKGVLLEKISTFVEWPDIKKEEAVIKKFVIGIFGKHKFGRVLSELYDERNIQNKEVEIKYINTKSEINDCRILFIPKLNNEELIETLEFVRKKPILTVSDSKGYAEKGVHINFYTEENNIRFEINENSVKESGLKMNHLLLSLAKLVESKG